MAYRKRIKQFCKDPIEQIENFEKANSSEEVYHVHHRLETELNVSRKWLKDNGLYYNRPASELIFLTRDEHRAVHGGKYCYLYGKNRELSPTYKRVCPVVLYAMRSVKRMIVKDIAHELGFSRPKITKELKFYKIT